MDEIKIKVVELQSFEAGLEGRFNTLRTMIRVPEFRDESEVIGQG